MWLARQIGVFIRELRRARQISLGRLAERAAVAKSTLSRWEAGVFQPRLPELEAVLAALQASPVQREQAIARVQAPRAVEQLRRDWAQSSELLGEDPDAFPAGGDLLRAMRRRQEGPGRGPGADGLRPGGAGRDAGGSR
jgi:transcriptional regulator with XRE-family HTH domain